MIVRVAVSFPFSDPYDYLVPDRLTTCISPGIRVLVPLGSRHVIGVVVKSVQQTTVGKLREIIEPVDQKPVYSPRILDLTHWIAGYYLCSWAESLDAALPGALKPRVQYRISVDVEKELFRQLSLSEQELLRSLEGKTDGLLKTPSYKEYDKQFKVWKKNNLLNLHPYIDTRATPSETEEYLRLNPEIVPTIKFRKGSKVDQLLEKLGNAQPIGLEQIKKSIPGCTPALRKLISQKAILSSLEPVIPQISLRRIIDERFLELNPEQAQALSQIQSAIQNEMFTSFLLFGVTGSGKTEVYLHAVRNALLLGKSVLVLIPEISLTPQAVERFEERFGERVAVLHSGLTDKERASEWLKIRNKQCDIVVGARSAIFAPLDNLGLIVVDEEHDSSYKQQETPYYNARDVAVKLASDLKATVILGSATPSIESFHNTRSGKYQLLELTQRANLKPMPESGIISLKHEKRQSGAFYLSTVLVEKLKETIAEQKQALVFLNRRGFASFLSCKECEMPVLCRNCSIAMTWHKTRKRLVCHHCGDTRNYPSHCEACGEKSFRMEGIGTQRIEQDLRRLFPEARFLRMDRDSIQKRGTLEKSIEKINNREVDFVVGTQLISKGHDFKYIGVVCIVLADMSLNFPDFRSSERTFQLISQVSGRAGRDDVGKGLTLIQTYNPDHFAIRAAVENDYRGFYQQEIEARKTLENPPFTRLILLKISSTNPQHAQQSAQKLGLIFKEQEKIGLFQVLGPIEAPIQKVNRRFYWQILLKTEKAGELKRFVKQLFWERKIWQPTGATRVAIDVDPYLMI